MPDKQEEFGEFYEKPREPESEAPAPVPRRRRRRLRGEGGSPLASRWKRLGAHLLDNVIVWVPGFPLILWYLEASSAGELDADVPGWIMATSGVLVLALGIVNAYYLSVRGQTLGKMALKIRIVDYRSEANPGFGRAVLMRWFLPAVINAFCGLFSLIDVLFIFGEEKRCVHDLMATTKVIDGEARAVDPDVFA